jgi:hypothetical protein
MHRAPLAEFLLSRFTTRESAAAIIGDLLEIAPRRIAFWLAVLHTAAKFAVTPLAGVLASTATAWLLVFDVYPRGMWPLDLAGMSFGIIAAYSGVRRGPFDLDTAISATLCALVSAGIFLHSSIPALVTTGVVTVTLLVGSLADSRARSAVARILAAAVGAIVTMFVVYKLLTGPTTPAHLRPPVWLPMGVLFLIPAAVTGFVLSWSRPTPRAKIAE